MWESVACNTVRASYARFLTTQRLFLSAWCGDRGKTTCNIRILYVAVEAVLCATAAVVDFLTVPAHAPHDSNIRTSIFQRRM